MTTFRELGVRSEIADALEAEGIIDAFPIQAMALPIGLGGHDIIGQARTGTGKTLAFGIPLLQRIEHGGKAPRGLVLAPTRELALQVTDDLLVAGGKLGTRVLPVYGGRAYEPQIQALRDGVDVVVGTPGRLLDLVRQRYLDLSRIEMLVLDEADRMLDLGFLPDIERIVEQVPARRQTMLFSATMPGEIVALSRRYLTRPTNVRAEASPESLAAPQVVQHVFQAHQMDKPEMLARLLQAAGRGLTMVFCQTKRTCDRVAADLGQRGFAAAAVHGDLGQGQRERALRAFRAGKIDVLVATDVAARGLDVDDVTHVVNFECPDSADTHVHRIGRTGRAGKEGIAVTLVDWSDLPRWKLINSALDLPFAEPPETYSTSDHFYEALAIPAGVTGTLPKDQRDRAGLAAEELEDIGETGKTRSRDRDRDAAKERPSRPRKRNRQRVRTRGGKPVTGEEPAEPTDTDVAAPADDDVVAIPAGAPTGRRTRGRTTQADADVLVDEPAGLEVPADESTRPRARRRTAQADAAGDERATPPGAADEPTGGRTRRRTRKADAPINEPTDLNGTTEESTGTADEPTGGRTRRRTRKADAPINEPTDVDGSDDAGAQAVAHEPIVPPTDTVSGVPMVTFQPPPSTGNETEPVAEPPQRQQQRARSRRRSRTGRASDRAH